jgi:hypothetical protein
MATRKSAARHLPKSGFGYLVPMSQKFRKSAWYIAAELRVATTVRVTRAGQMGNEIELKFAVPPRELQKLKAAQSARRKPPKEENLVSVYFDTPKHKLASKGGFAACAAYWRQMFPDYQIRWGRGPLHEGRMGA